MPDDQDMPGIAARDISAVLGERVTAAPAPPAPMPDATRPLAQAASVVTNPAPAVEPPEKPAAGGWAVDQYRFSAFVDAIDMVRYRLRAVAATVERMRSASYTPKLGTSPVAQQLEQKFAERLDAPLDDPAHPTTGGLRPMLAEAMRRMEEFVAGAEDAARAYRDLDESAAVNINRYGQNG